MGLWDDTGADWDELALGDGIVQTVVHEVGGCTEGDCTEGAANVKQLQDYYASVGKPAQYAAAVDALVSAYKDADGKWTRHLPFSTVCCEIRALGEQAKALTQQIGAATGNKAPPALEAPKTVTDKLTTLVTVGAVAVGGLLLYQLITAKRAR
jgi:hypothetical protein